MQHPPLSPRPIEQGPRHLAAPLEFAERIDDSSSMFREGAGIRGRRPVQRNPARAMRFAACRAEAHEPGPEGYLAATLRGSGPI